MFHFHASSCLSGVCILLLVDFHNLLSTFTSHQPYQLHVHQKCLSSLLVFSLHCPSMPTFLSLFLNVSRVQRLDNNCTNQKCPTFCYQSQSFLLAVNTCCPERLQEDRGWINALHTNDEKQKHIDGSWQYNWHGSSTYSVILLLQECLIRIDSRKFTSAYQGLMLSHLQPLCQQVESCWILC